MTRILIIVIWFILFYYQLFSQESKDLVSDTLRQVELKEIVVISTKSPTHQSIKPLATVDNYLETASSINMLRRGIYAWEPFINGISSERGAITIDGMHIYGACTDKMDPITSYVEITNLEKASIQTHPVGINGASISGSMDLIRKKNTFGNKSIVGSIFSGYETNNQHKIFGGTFSSSTNKIFANIDFTYRDAENYKSGSNKVVNYSQFTKYNLSSIVGYKINNNSHAEISIIYDKATDIGYPALPMDVSSAEAIIGSVEYTLLNVKKGIDRWRTKFYYNDITHIMDDSKRPDVPIRMDMPGWSTTAGFYTIVEGNYNSHRWQANLSGHRNKSLAEMTMYSNNPEEKDMFMLTWPGVYTNYLDLFLADNHRLTTNWALNYAAGLSFHQNEIYSDFGFESLQIFFPDIDKIKSRLLTRVSISADYQQDIWAGNLGIGYSERAPSVSEGYGFYLFNSFDRYDYIGNPKMKNEKGIFLNTSLSTKISKLSTKLSGSYFLIWDYIIGIPKKELSVMTIGAYGVKIYEQINNANIFNVHLDLNYNFTENLIWSNKMSYRYGVGDSIETLPLIQPFTYISKLAYQTNKFTIEAWIDGSSAKNMINPDFGEKPLPSYVIANLSASYRFVLDQKVLLIKLGVDNLFDASYTTFADWNRLPRMGRNIYLNLIFGL